MTTAKEETKAAAKAAAAPEVAPEARMPMAEGTRQELEMYGRAVDPFTCGVYRKHPETGAVEYYAPGEPVPDDKPKRA